MLLNRIAWLFMTSSLLACSTVEPVVPSEDLPALEIEIEGGRIAGVEEGETRVFRGIPFAAPPTGERRFEPPAAVIPWTDTRDASTYGPVCPQPALFGEGFLKDTDEDCLTLNVWTPRVPPATSLPVMVFFHGGAFVGGSSRGIGNPIEANASYTGEHLVPKGNVLLVTVNYRLGALGFLTDNHGLLDQQAALAWVERNVASFGGDPDNVTIFGESAGGISVCAHMRAPGSRGLFHKAISQSGPCDLLIFDETGADARRRALLDALGCDDIACVKEKPASEVLAAQLESPTANRDWGPVEGYASLPVGRDDVADVPLMLGTNKDEGTLFLTADYGDLDAADYEKALEDALNIDEPAAASVAAAYAVSDYPSAFWALSTAFTHAFMTCPVRTDARTLTSPNETYVYQLTHPVKHNLSETWGVAHGIELLLVFGTNLGLLGSLDDADLALSNTVIGYWSRFAHHGDPNGDGAPAWPAFGSDEAYLELTDPPRSGAALIEEECDFLDGIAAGDG